MARGSTTLEPDELLADLLRFDDGLTRELYWGERSIFYNPGRAGPLGVIFASIKDHDGANNRSSSLSRVGVYRFAFQLREEEYEARFGAVPGRPPKGAWSRFPSTTRRDHIS